MTNMGHNLKVQVAQRERPRARAFYAELLGADELPSPSPSMELFRLSDGTTIGVYYVEDGQALSEESYRSATWLEIETSDITALMSRLRALGVKEIDYTDREHFYFHAPGGQVFRLAQGPTS